MKVHTMKYLKIAMICSVVNFVANNRGNKTAILLLLAATLFSPIVFEKPPWGKSIKYVCM